MICIICASQKLSSEKKHLQIVMDNIQLSPEVLLDFAGWFSHIKMYPYFDAAHYIFMCLAVRDDLATGLLYFDEQHSMPICRRLALRTKASTLVLALVHVDVLQRTASGELSARRTRAVGVQET